MHVGGSGIPGGLHGLEEVEHRQLVEHLQLEAERRVEGDTPEPHQHQQGESHPHLPGKVCRESPSAGEDHRQAGDVLNVSQTHGRSA